MAEPAQDGIPHLLAETLRDARDLLSKEIALFRAEIGDGVRMFGLGLGVVGLAALLVIVGSMVLIGALVKWLALVIGSEALAALIVGGVFAIITLVLAVWGGSKVAVRKLAPKRTVHALRRDVAADMEHLRR